MRATLCVLALVAGCYSPHLTAGAPCSPAEANCPGDQTCALVGGDFVCVEGSVVGEDAGASDGSPGVDVPVPIDARTDDALVPSVWSIVQSRTSMNAGSTTMAASGAGHLIVVAMETGNNPATSVTDNVGNTYVPIVRAIDNGNNIGLELWYAKDTTAGATVVTASASTLYAIVLWEAAGVRTTNPLDTSTKLDNQASSTSPDGAIITTGAAGDFVISVAIMANQVSSIHAGNEFTNDHKTFGNGWAHLTDPGAPAGSHQAKWDQPTSGTYCSASVAFFVGP